MIAAAERNRVKLMTAYRLHFEKANLTAIETVRSGKIGEARFFSSVFSMNVEEGNIRLNPIAMGGGTLYDIGIYCINASRYLFRSEPEEVFGVERHQRREAIQRLRRDDGVRARFPGERLAASSRASARRRRGPTARGHEGRPSAGSAYEYAEPMEMPVTSAKVPSGPSPGATSSLPSWSISPSAFCGARARAVRREGWPTSESSKGSIERRGPGRLPEFPNHKRRRPTIEQEITAPVRRRSRAARRGSGPA